MKNECKYRHTKGLCVCVCARVCVTVQTTTPKTPPQSAPIMNMLIYFLFTYNILTIYIYYSLQELRTSSTGAGTETGVGAGTGNGGIADGDFWIGLMRTEGEHTQENGGFASCSDLYLWTDGSVSQFRCVCFTQQLLLW